MTITEPYTAAADQARVPALRDDGRPRLVADGEDRGDLLGRAGPNDEPRGRAVAPGRVLLEGRPEVGIVQDVTGSDDLGEAGDQGICRSWVVQSGSGHRRAGKGRA